MSNHQIPYYFVMSIFISGLYLIGLKPYVKEGTITTYAQAYAIAKTWEKCRLENELVIYTDNTYSNNPIPSHSETFPITENDQYFVMDVPYVWNSNAPLSIQPTIDKSLNMVMQMLNMIMLCGT